MGINLSELKNRYWDFTVKPGETYHIKKASFELSKKLKNQDYKGDESVCLVILEEMVLSILNNNVEKKKFNKKWLDDNGIDYMVQTVIVMDYTNWMQDVLSNPNFKSLTR